MDFQKYNSADCWCNVTGHSMEPSISHGDIIALKEIKEWRIFRLLEKFMLL
uniref:S24 family peptidase n=1 Tax=Dysgonomonas sp. TaxID=1891233 RepID=UPI0039E4DC5A